MNNIIYILMCEVWNGSNYGTEIVGAYTSSEKAENDRKAFQGKTPTCDTRYFIERTELI